MSDTCTYEKEKLKQCKKSYEFLKLKNARKGQTLKINNWNTGIISFCPFCGVNIQKPKAEPVIDLLASAKNKAIKHFAYEMITSKKSLDAIEQARVIVETIEIYITQKELQEKKI